MTSNSDVIESTPTTSSRGWISTWTLLAAAMLGTIGWHVEITMHGWRGLDWLNYFHWAVPAGVAFFLAWIFFFSAARKRIWLLAVLVAIAPCFYVAVDLALNYFFVAGPSAMFMVVGSGGFDQFMSKRRTLLAVWPTIPFVYCAICRLFGVRISPWRWAASLILFPGSWPAAAALRELVLHPRISLDGWLHHPFQHNPSPDYIEALKGGWVIPFLVVSLGLPLLVLPLQQASVLTGRDDGPPRG